MTKKLGYQNKNIRAQLEASAKVIVKKGYATYLTFIGWCKECKLFRVHTEPAYISYYGPTCSQGHYSDGKLPANKLLNKLKKK